MKQLAEEVSRSLWWISEKEKTLKILEEKEVLFMMKQNKVRQRHEALKKEYDDIIMSQPELLDNQYKTMITANNP